MKYLQKEKLGEILKKILFSKFVIKILNFLIIISQLQTILSIF